MSTRETELILGNDGVDVGEAKDVFGRQDDRGCV